MNLQIIASPDGSILWISGAHRRVQGALVKLDHPSAASTVWQILHAAGIDSAPAVPARTGLFDRLLIVNEHHLRRVLTEYLRHYNAGRRHRALGQLAPAQAGSRPPQVNPAEHRIRRKQVLSGLTHEYQIVA